MTRQSSGFVADTLIHTQNGFVPIEQIKVGDLVLSRPEHKEELQYKGVVQTYKFDPKDIVLVRYYRAHPAEVIEQQGVTGNHLYWVNGIGWTRADELSQGNLLELADGTNARVICAAPLFRTLEPDVAWAAAPWGLELNDGSGYRVRFGADGSITVDEAPSFNNEVLSQGVATARFQRNVFNIEVESCHTYYVGRSLGAWVHNVNAKM